MAEQVEIRGPFGSSVTAEIPVTPEPSFEASALPQDGARVPMNNAAFAGARSFQEWGADREARAARPVSTTLEAVGAAITQWDTTRLLDRIGRPTFADDEAIDQHAAFEQLGMRLTDDERDFIAEVGKGKKSWQYAVQVVQDRKQAMSVIGDHPIAGTLTQFVDPLWLVVPPAVRVGRTSAKVGRAVSAASAGALGAAVTAAGEGPVSDTEIALSLIMNSAAGAAFYTPGKGLVRNVDEVAETADATVRAVTAPSTKPHVKQVAPGVWEEVPPELRRGSTATQEEIAVAVDRAVEQDNRARGLAGAVMWNMHKTMSGFGPVGKKVADLFYDDNLNLGKLSVESNREAVLDALRQHQVGYEYALREQMAKEGAGLWQMANPLTSRKAAATQARIERELQHELFRREQLSREGLPVSNVGVRPEIARMADKLDELHRQALHEMKAAGVEGAENLLERPGYMNRRWSSASIERTLDKLKQAGLTQEQALKRVHALVGMAVRRGGKLDQRLSEQIGSAIVDRALRRGYFEDSVFNAPSSAGTLAELRDILTEAKLPHADVERALDVLRVQADEAGKAGYMKHRLDLDYKASMRVAGQNFRVTDLIDSNVSTIVDQYIKRVSTNAAFARAGYKKPSDIARLRSEFLESVPYDKRADAEQLFDNTLAHYRGDPAGVKLNDTWRTVQAYTRAISLAWSGLWQATEYATAMGKFGLLKTLKYAMQEMPGFKQLMRPDSETASSLNVVLSEHSVANLRLRPFLTRYEDGFEMDMGSALQLSAQQWGNMVPFANGMKFVHHHQAKIVGNLIMDRLRMAANGHSKAREALAKYGLEAPVMDKLSAEIKAKGFNVDAWDDALWHNVRPALTKMMDESVLKGRLGDVPAFAAFDPIGKFLFTYRTFVLTAHNKVMAGTVARDGAAALGLILMYQFPLAMAAVQAQSVVKGEGMLSDEDLAKKAVGQMGGLGLFSEPFKWATGQSNSVGAPGLIAVDRAVKLGQGVLQMDAQQGGSALVTMLPVLASTPFLRAVEAQIKE